MKKLFAIVLALVLAAGCALPCLAEEEPVRFEPQLAGAMGYTAQVWMENGINRALLSVLLWLETGAQEDAESKLNYSASLQSGLPLLFSFVGINEENMLLVVLCADDSYALWAYDPAQGVVSAVRIDAPDGTAAEAAEAVLKDSCVSYEANNPDDITAVVQALSSAVQSNG